MNNMVFNDNTNCVSKKGENKMENTKYVARLVWVDDKNKKRFPKLANQIILMHYSKMRNAAVDLINERLDEWNTEFNKTHGDIGTHDIENPDDPYVKFIVAQQQRYYDAVNRGYGDHLVKLVPSKVCPGDVGGQLFGRDDLEFYITLEPAK
jgi:hypothetical protein